MPIRRQDLRRQICRQGGDVLIAHLGHKGRVLHRSYLHPAPVSFNDSQATS
jgi:hypothetical protein